MKKTTFKGFTIIELIVVVAIIGILAAIIVPSMIRYMTESKLSTANANAKLAYTTSATYLNSCVVSGNPPAGNISLECVSVKWEGSSAPEVLKTATVDDFTNALRAQMGSSAETSGFVSVKVGNNDIPVVAIWGRGQNDPCIGQYPDQRTTVTESPESSWAL